VAEMCFEECFRTLFSKQVTYDCYMNPHMYMLYSPHLLQQDVTLSCWTLATFSMQCLVYIRELS